MHRALRDRRFLITSWPWRALGYLLTTVPISAVLGGALSFILLPWLVSAGRLRHGLPLTERLMIWMVFGGVLFALFAPLVAVPLAVIERSRLAIADPRPVASAHTPVLGSPAGWIRVRYTEAATWREVLYGCVLGLVVPIVYAALALLALIDFAFILSPAAAYLLGNITWQLASFQLTTGARSIPVALLGLVLAPVLAYLTGLVAAGQAAAARALLGVRSDPGRRSDTELREVARSRQRLVDAFDAERRRIERDLHDGAQHRLTSLALQLGVARLDLPAGSPAAEPLGQAHDQAKELMVVLRELIHGIRPQTLTELGLPAALRELAAQSPVDVAVTVGDDVTRTARGVEGTAYFVASEALTNAARHGAATRVEMHLARAGEALILEIRDDGLGGADPAGGSGLTGLADRVAAVGGRLLLASPAGGPTLVRVELPWSR
jgi:signal transduction histidine kinase